MRIKETEVVPFIKYYLSQTELPGNAKKSAINKDKGT